MATAARGLRAADLARLANQRAPPGASTAAVLEWRSKAAAAAEELRALQQRAKKGRGCAAANPKTNCGTTQDATRSERTKGREQEETLQREIDALRARVRDKERGGHTGWARSPPRGRRRRGNFARASLARTTRLPNPPPSPSPSPRARRARRRSPRRWRRSALLSTCTSGSGGRRWSARSDSRRRRTEELAASLSFARCRNPPERKPAARESAGRRRRRVAPRDAESGRHLQRAPSPTRSRIRCAISSPRRRRLATRWKVRSGAQASARADAADRRRVARRAHRDARARVDALTADRARARSTPAPAELLFRQAQNTVRAGLPA